MSRIDTLIFIFILTVPVLGENYHLTSPDKKSEIIIFTDSTLALQVKHHSKLLFDVGNLFIELNDRTRPGRKPVVARTKRRSVDEQIRPAVKEKFATIRDRFNELRLDFESDFSLIVRAYDEGIAYRFSTNLRDSITIKRETMALEFAESDSIYFQKSKSFNSSYETPYQHEAIRDITTDGYCCLPVLIEKQDGVKVLISESDLDDYPGLWLKATGSPILKSAHAGYPLEFITEGSPYRRGQVAKHAAYIAKVRGPREFPWRVFIISEHDSDLLTSTLIYQLAKPQQIDDVSWIQPGVVTFDWWGRRNIYGADFKAGINTETARYFIDFAADFGFDYFLFDDGWSKQDDLLTLHTGLNMEEVVAYAREKKVKLMLWVIWNTFEMQWDAAWKQFEKWGISGIKFDFMNRDDQKMVQFYHRVAQEAVKQKMVIDFHGAYKPTGLRRTYPNVLTREALIEFEYNGRTDRVTPDHDNLLPYIRMVTGPMDYIPFTTRNAQKKNFRPVGDRPMGQGTRAHAMALFVILASPMQMLPDSPSDYYRERECTEFLADIPVEWDDLKVLHAKIGDYTVLARRKGKHWYIGAITDWMPREFEIQFDFLSEGIYKLDYMEDGVNAATRAIDYNHKTARITRKDRKKIELAPGGGWIAKVIKIN